MDSAILVPHIVSGALGLVIGPVAAVSRGRLHASTYWGYHACTATLCTTALMLVLRSPGLWPLAPIAVGTQAAALAAVVVRRRRHPGWRPLHARLAIGSYISFVTAFVVQTAGGLWFVLPVAVGIAVSATVVERLKQAELKQAEQPPRPAPVAA